MKFFNVLLIGACVLASSDAYAIFTCKSLETKEDPANPPTLWPPLSPPYTIDILDGYGNRADLFLQTSGGQYPPSYFFFCKLVPVVEANEFISEYQCEGKKSEFYSVEGITLSVDVHARGGGFVANLYSKGLNLKLENMKCVER